jgi:hypothetical protein
VKRRPPPRPDRAPAGRYDRDRGSWLVPISDAWLDLLSREWSRPVQLKAETTDDGKTYTIRVRDAAQHGAIEQLVELIARPGSTLRDYRGDWNRGALRDAIERVLEARG